MRTEVRDIIGELVADFWTDAELNRYLNEAQYRFLNEERWPWLVTEGSNTLNGEDPDLILEEGIAATRHINITLLGQGSARTYQPRRVTPAEGFRLANSFSASTTSTYPEFFYTTAVSSPDDDGVFVWVVRFIPTPTSDLDVTYQYYRSSLEMTADSSPELPVEYHKALVHYAAGTAWLKELNGEHKASEQFSLYAGIVEQARGEWLVQPDDDPLVMGSDPNNSLYAGHQWMRDLELDQPLGP
jgi:hypothetical protein